MKIAIVGHSHVVCMAEAVEKMGGDYRESARIINLKMINRASAIIEDYDLALVERRLIEASEGTVLTVL